jgi:hypothetical protein
MAKLLNCKDPECLVSLCVYYFSTALYRIYLLSSKD